MTNPSQENYHSEKIIAILEFLLDQSAVFGLICDVTGLQVPIS